MQCRWPILHNLYHHRSPSGTSHSPIFNNRPILHWLDTHQYAHSIFLPCIHPKRGYTRAYIWQPMFSVAVVLLRAPLPIHLLYPPYNSMHAQLIRSVYVSWPLVHISLPPLYTHINDTRTHYFSLNGDVQLVWNHHLLYNIIYIY